MKVICRTNLDLPNESWPSDFPSVPQLKHEIVSKTKWGQFQLSLQVVAVKWEYSEYYGFCLPHIELHLSEFHGQLTCSNGKHKGSVTAFFEWYNRLTGKS